MFRSGRRRVKATYHAYPISAKAAPSTSFADKYARVRGHKSAASGPGANGGIVMEGRDIGTKVFPDADVKVFLDADPVVREQRRLEQLRAKGIPADSKAADVRERDRRDRTRASSPLVAAPDAVVLDSTSLSEDEVLQRVEELVQRKLV